MEKYTVLLLYPDYIAETYGHETYLAHVRASSPAGAVLQAQQDALAANPEYADDGEPTDFYPLFCTFGYHSDINP